MGNIVDSSATGSFTLSVSQLKALVAHASKDETRIHLCGVYFDRDAMVATDGHRLIAAPIAYASPSGSWDPFLAPTSELKSAIKMAGTSGRVVIKVTRELASGPAPVTGRTTGRKIEIHAYDRREKHVGTCGSVASNVMFPPWRQVVPRLESVKPVIAHVNSAYMADLALVADAFDASCGVEYLGSDGNDLGPMVYAVGPDSCRDVIVVIMPMRGKYSAKCIRATEETEARALIAA